MLEAHPDADGRRYAGGIDGHLLIDLTAGGGDELEMGRGVVGHVADAEGDLEAVRQRGVDDGGSCTVFAVGAVSGIFLRLGLTADDEAGITDIGAAEADEGAEFDMGIPGEGERLAEEGIGTHGIDLDWTGQPEAGVGVVGVSALLGIHHPDGPEEAAIWPQGAEGFGDAELDAHPEAHRSDIILLVDAGLRLIDVRLDIPRLRHDADGQAELRDLERAIVRVRGSEA